MARAVLLAAATAWLVAGLAAVGLAVVGADAIVAFLPPLAISGEALARTVGALGVGGLVIGLVHAAVAAGLARGHHWATSAGILVAGVSAAGFVALAAAALTAGAAGSMAGAAAIATAVGALIVAVAYGAVGVALAHRLRAGPHV